MDQPNQFSPPVARSNWPSTLGIFGIIFGILGFLYSASQLINTLMMKAMGGSIFTAGAMSAPSPGATDEEADAMAKAMEEAMIQMMADMNELGKTKIFADGGLLILGILLFIGGILLMQRYRVSKPILLGWSYAKLVIGSWAALLTKELISGMGGSMGAVFNAQMESATSGSSSSPPPFDMVKMYEMMGMASLVGLVIWGAILPIFFIIWFSRQDIKEDMATGYGWK